MINADVPSPVGHGWTLEGEEAQRLTINWMSRPPAPRAVIELLSCMCRKACNDDSCECIRNGLKCSDICRLTNCSNQPEEEEEEGVYIDVDDEDVDFD